MTGFLIALFLLQPSTEAVVPPVFPVSFHGVWDVDADACSGGHSDYRIQIASDRISYWESDGTPLEIFNAGENDVFVTLAMSGEGETWRSQTRFVVDQRGSQLFAEAMPQVGESYYKTIWFYHRCADGTPMGWGDQ